MILTITLNPSVDISYQLPSFQLNQSNRSQITNKTSGGKGLNVTRVLNCLKVPIKATGFLGGTNGLFIQKELDQMKIQHDFVSIHGDTRNCIAILDGVQQTEILEEGPAIMELESELFLEKIECILPKAEIVVASGSLPKGLSKSFYKELIKLAHHYNKPFLLDTSGESLEKTIEAQPTFIKPNLSEFGALIGEKVESEEEIVDALKTAQFHIPYVMVSLGEKGALIKHNETIYKCSIPNVRAVNPVGSGDATVAGFAAGMLKGYKDQQLFSYSVLMGLLNAIEEKTGFVNSSFISRYMNEIKVEPIS